MRVLLLLLLFSLPAFAEPETPPRPLPIDPLWESESFRKAVTGSFGIDSRIEPRITVDEEHYLKQAAEAMAAGNRKNAISILRESDLLERSIAITFQLATLRFEEGELDEAVTLFQSALDRFPNFRDAHRNLAIAFVRQNKLDEAVPHLTRAVELGSREGLTMGLLGYCHAAKGNHRAALDAYRLASLTQPDEAQWKTGQAQELQHLGEPEDAAAIYQELLESNPENSAIWQLQADAWIALERPLYAIANLELAHRSGSLSPAATLSLGHLFLQEELPDLALSRYEAAVDREAPVAPTRAVEAIELLLSRGDYERAATLTGAVKKSYRADQDPDPFPEEVRSRLTRANALIEFETGDGAAGAEMLEALLQSDPTDGDALILLSRFHESKGSREEAEMLLEQAATLPDHAATAHRALGKLLVAAGEYEKAIVQLEKSLELSPDRILSGYLEAVRELVD